MEQNCSLNRLNSDEQLNLRLRRHVGLPLMMTNFVKGFNREEYRFEPSGPVVQPGILTWNCQAEERPVCKPVKRSRDRKVAGSNPARSTKIEAVAFRD